MIFFDMFESLAFAGAGGGAWNVKGAGKGMQGFVLEVQLVEERLICKE